jgi:small subunit ribosomal protein S7e
MLTLGLE